MSTCSRRTPGSATERRSSAGAAASGQNTSEYWPTAWRAVRLPARHRCVMRSKLAQEGVRDRPGAVGPGAPALDQHGERQIAAVSDEPPVRRRGGAASRLGRPGLAVDPRWEASMANVELHDAAKAVCSVVVPRCSLLSLWKILPPMVTWLGHRTALVGRIPVLASADAVTTLNVEPGGNSPSSARSNPPGRSTTASTLPVDGWTATRSTGLRVAAAPTACDAACCTRISMLVRTGLPGEAADRAAVASM